MACIFQALSQVPPELCVDIMRFYHTSEICSGFLWELRTKCASYIEATILDSRILGIPLDPNYKNEWAYGLLQQMLSTQAVEAELLRHVVDSKMGFKLYEKLDLALQIEIHFLSDFWMSGRYNQIHMCRDLIQPDEVSFGTLVGVDTQQRFRNVLAMLYIIGQPFIEKQLLPVSQNFRAWLPYETLKENYKILTDTLGKIHETTEALRQQSTAAGICTEIEITSILQWQEKIGIARRNLALQSMVISKQPGHCVKKNTRIELELRVLDSAFLKFDTDTTPIQVALLNYEQASFLYQNQVIAPQIQMGCTALSTDIRLTHRDDFTGHITVVIPERPSAKEVLKEKYYFLLYTEVGSYSLLTPGVIQGPQVWACSAPFVIITNDNQQRRANFTIFWDLYVNAPRHFEPSIPATFGQVYTGFLEYTKKKTQTTWDLGEINLKFLASFITQENDFTLATRIPREKLDKVGYAGWDWYYDTLKLIKGPLHEYWQRGLIIGFIDRAEAERILQIAGGFLFRFSQSKAGQLVVSYNFSGHEPVNELLEELWVRRLNQFVRDVRNFTYLYHLKAPGSQLGMTNKMDAFTLSPPPSPAPPGTSSPYKRLLTMTFN